jgi:small subunit ribosomal protein S13
MVYVFNKYIPPKKTIKSALTLIYGIGEERAKKIANALCFNPNKRFYTLGFLLTQRINKHIASNYKVGVTLRATIIENIKKLVKLRCYRGMRHKNNLPVRGQRTHTNAQTQKKIGTLRFARMP